MNSCHKSYSSHINLFVHDVNTDHNQHMPVVSARAWPGAL